MAKTPDRSGAAPSDGDRPSARPGRPALSPFALLRTCVLYLAIVFGLTAIIMLPSVQASVVEPFIGALTVAVAQTLGLLGIEARAAGSNIVGPDISVKVVDECTGIEALVLLVAAILVFPGPWRAKGIGLALATGVMAVVNFVRIVSLCYVSTFSAAALEFGHLYLWPVVVIMTGLVTLFFWAQRFAVPER